MLGKNLEGFLNISVIPHLVHSHQIGKTKWSNDSSITGTRKLCGNIAQYPSLNISDSASLYVHWPYCEKRCSYCNFNKYIEKSVNDNRMKQCFITELDTLLTLSQVQEITSIYFGGGTPSLACPSLIEAIVQFTKKFVSHNKNIEITLEVNPAPNVVEKLRKFRDAGVNRVSVGIQTLKTSDLLMLGRNHSIEDSLRCLEACCSLFPGKTSVDIIIGRPKQQLSDLEEELKQILQICDDHISMYQLTVERGTELFKKVKNQTLSMPSQTLIADFYDLAVQILESNGFHRYEVSNFARIHQARSAHNLSYWAGEQYIGIGPGAHGRFIPKKNGSARREARIQTLEPLPWMSEVENFGHGTRKATPLSEFAIQEEILMLALRTSAGLSHEQWHKFCSIASLNDIFDSSSSVQNLQANGFLIMDQCSLRFTPSGLALADWITAELLSTLHKYYASKSLNNC